MCAGRNGGGRVDGKIGNNNRETVNTTICNKGHSTTKCAKWMQSVDAVSGKR